MLIILCFWLISISMHYSEWGGRWRWGMIYIVLRCYWGARGPQPPCYLSQLSLYLFASCMTCPELAWWQMFFSTIVYISGQFTKYQSNVLDFFSNLYMLLYLPAVSYFMPYQSRIIFVSSLYVVSFWMHHFHTIYSTSLWIYLEGLHIVRF